MSTGEEISEVGGKCLSRLENELFLVPKQTGADFIDATNMETNPNKYTVDGVYFCTTNSTCKLKQKMFCFLVETLEKFRLPLYL